jgi:predicted GNAT family acetyltransferase
MMPYPTNLKEMAATGAPPLPLEAISPTTRPLTEDDCEEEILAFLAENPVHTVVMRGLIADNGLESSFNRGTFYACRDAGGKLSGVALIGHAMFVEARNSAALESFARLAQEHGRAHMILGEQETVRRFWSSYSEGGQPMRLFCRELLFEQRWPAADCEPVEGLRAATLDDLMLIMPVHAALAYEESGVNPLDADFDGFRLRCARRIELGRVWVWVKDGQLIFKADIASETPECIYIEGGYVDRQERGKGYGLRCLTQMARELLERTQVVSVLVNEQNSAARRLVSGAGFKLGGYYDTIFLQQMDGQEGRQETRRVGEEGRA